MHQDWVMSIKEAEEALFSEWREIRDGFVSDGVMDEEAYLASRPKLLFLLKEVNDPAGGDWDLREVLREGGRAQTWNNVTRWIEGIRRLPQDTPWSQLSRVDKDRRTHVLRSIVVINIKKSPGGHTADVDLLRRITREDAEYLQRQFALYEPDVVISCGSATTATFLDAIGTSDVVWQRTTRGIRYHQIPKGGVFIDYSHPAARCAPQLLHYPLVDAVREMLFGRAET